MLTGPPSTVRRVAIGLAVAIGGVAAPAVAAAEPTGTDPGARRSERAGANQAGANQAGANRKDRRERGRARAEKLATELGVSVEDLRAALRSTRDLMKDSSENSPAARREARATALADELGVTVDQLKAASLAVATAAVDARVEHGDITREQGDKLIRRATSGRRRR